jgi:hypothetical protein
VILPSKTRGLIGAVVFLHFITSDEIERIHKEVLKFERIEAISDPMR